MIGGRKWWLAWPAGLLCAGIVAGLAYYAAPAVPGVLAYTVEMVQQGARTQAVPVPTAKPIDEIGTALTDDCVSLYTTVLWLELTFQPHTVLGQDMTAPDAELMTALAAWHPSPRMTCAWRQANGGTVRTSLVDLRVPATGTQTESGDAAQRAIAVALGKRGYGCLLSGSGAALLTCTRTSGVTTETEVFDGSAWLSDRESGWHPAGYMDALVDRLWPHPSH
jgi:hypothetical protein